MQSFTPPRRILKTGLAAGLAWTAAQQTSGTVAPYFAPLAAILTLQVTVADSLLYSVQRVAGVVAGVSLAAFLFHSVPINGATLGIMVLFSMAIGRLMGLGAQATAQVAISAVLVAAIGERTPHYALMRAIDTAIGAAVAVIVNAVIAPASHLPALATALSAYCARLEAVLSAFGEALAGDNTAELVPAVLQQARDTNHGFSAVRDAVALSAQGLKWNYRARHDRPAFDAYRQVADHLESVSILVRGMARTVADDGGQVEWHDRCAFAAMLVDCAAVCGELGGRLWPTPNASEREVTVEKVRASCRTTVFDAAAPGQQPWWHAGSLLTDCERMLEALSLAVAASPAMPPA